jgi:lincosamide nucleotidyltransferase A/C/D/E
MKPEPKDEMTAQDVVQLMKRFEQNQLEVVLDGGWGVDALIGEQTRVHGDLDIVIAYHDVPRLRMLLEGNGYSDVPRIDTRPVNFVMGDGLGHLVDIHTYSLDRINHPEQGLDYPPESLKGTGTILGYSVSCIDLENMVKFHTGYTLDENDYHDIKALCERFGIPIPVEYDAFVARDRLNDRDYIDT